MKGFEAVLTVSGGINDFFGGLPGKIMGVVAAIVAMRVALGFVGDIAPVATEAGFSLEELASMAANAAPERPDFC